MGIKEKISKTKVFKFNNKKNPMRDGLSKANVVLFILKKNIFVSEGDEEGMENWPISRPPGTPKSVFFKKNRLYSRNQFYPSP